MLKDIRIQCDHCDQNITVLSFAKDAEENKTVQVAWCRACLDSDFKLLPKSAQEDLKIHFRYEFMSFKAETWTWGFNSELGWQIRALPKKGELWPNSK